MPFDQFRPNRTVGQFLKFSLFLVKVKRDKDIKKKDSKRRRVSKDNDEDRYERVPIHRLLMNSRANRPRGRSHTTAE